MLLNNIDSLLSFSQKKQKEQDSGQVDLFGESVDSEVVAKSEIVLGPEDTNYSDQDYLQWERDLMGLYLSDHPLGVYEALLREKTHPIKDIVKEDDGKKANIGGIVNGVRVIQTKKGDNMAFVQMSDATGDIELLLFPSTYEQTAWLWEQDKVVLVEGSVNAKDREGNIVDDIKINVSSAREIMLEEAKAYKETGKIPKSLKEKKSPKSKAKVTKEQEIDRIYLRLESTDNTDQLLLLKQHIDKHEGSSEVVLVIGPAENKQVIRVPNKTSRSDESIDELIQLFGAENVKTSSL
jgi:DNA polymerase-3 subunit alpha